MIQQTIEYIGRITDADIDDPDMVWRALIGNVGVKSPSWTAAIFGIDMTRAFGLAISTKVLAV